MGKAVKALKGYAYLFPKVSPAHCGSVWKKASEGITPVYLIPADSVEAMVEQMAKKLYSRCCVEPSRVLYLECYKDARAALAAIGVNSPAVRGIKATKTKGKKL